MCLFFFFDACGNKRKKKEESNSAFLFLNVQGGRWDSNPRHSEPQSDALTN